MVRECLSRLCIGNLPGDATEDSLRDYFLTGSKVPRNSFSITMKKGCAFMHCGDQATAEVIIDLFHSTHYGGNTILIETAVSNFAEANTKRGRCIVTLNRTSDEENRNETVPSIQDFKKILCVWGGTVLSLEKFSSCSFIVVVADNHAGADLISALNGITYDGLNFKAVTSPEFLNTNAGFSESGDASSSMRIKFEEQTELPSSSNQKVNKSQDVMTSKEVKASQEIDKSQDVMTSKEVKTSQEVNKSPEVKTRKKVNKSQHVKTGQQCGEKRKKGFIYFDGITCAEFNSIVKESNYPKQNDFKTLMAGELIVKMEGWLKGPGNQTEKDESVKQKYTTTIMEFPELSKKMKKIIIPVSFDVEGRVPDGIGEHLAVLYVDVEMSQAFYFCQMGPSLYRDAVRTSVMPRIRTALRVPADPKIKYEHLPMGTIHTISYPNSCALLALWVTFKIFELGFGKLPGVAFPKFQTMHRFRNDLKLAQDAKENHAPKKQNKSQ